MSPSAREYLLHILDETTYIITSSNGLEKAAFLKDETLKRAYVRSIEVIGEAVKQLPDALHQQHTAINWRAMAGMRDHLIHHYFGVDYDVVWDVVINKIPALVLRLDAFLNRMNCSLAVGWAVPTTSTVSIASPIYILNRTST